MQVIANVARFWYDFIVGEDPVIAVGMVLTMVVTALLTANQVNAWWLMVIGVIASLSISLVRATRR